MRIESFSGDYRFLSNFWPAPVMFDGLEYPTVEHAYQAAKTLDPMARERIRLVRKAGAAKRLGRLVPLRPDWDQMKLSVMLTLVTEKFFDPDLRAQLIATGEAELIEGNYWGDTFWGVCRGVGRNHLGKILMEVRRSCTL